MSKARKNSMAAFDEFNFLLSVGGKPVSRGLKSFALTPDKVEEWNFGLLTDEGPPLFQKPPEARVTQELIRKYTPRFQLRGRLGRDPGNKVILWDVFKHPTVLEALNAYLAKIPSKTQTFSQFHQLTGSCVGTGSGNDATLAAAIEVAYKGEAEEPVVFWWPYTYGRGRFLGGMTSPGEGSMSESQVEAFLEGLLRADLTGLPVPGANGFKDDGDGYVLTSSQEIQWSDGDSQTVLPWLPKAKEHRFRSSAVIRSLDDARACIRDAKMPFLWCGNWGGLMQCEIKGTGNNRALVNRRRGVWNHNETAFAWWDNPELGELFGIMNQWGLTVHGADPGGLPPGAYWVARADMDYQLRQGSCIAVTAFDGFPALDLDLWNWR